MVPLYFKNSLFTFSHYTDCRLHEFAAALLGLVHFFVARPTVWNSLPDHPA